MTQTPQHPPMTYEQLKQSHDEWRMLAMHNYGVAKAAEGREQRLIEAIKKAQERFKHGNVIMALIEGSMILTDALDTLYPDTPAPTIKEDENND